MTRARHAIAAIGLALAACIDGGLVSDDAEVDGSVLDSGGSLVDSSDSTVDANPPAVFPDAAPQLDVARLDSSDLSPPDLDADPLGAADDGGRDAGVDLAVPRAADIGQQNDLSDSADAGCETACVDPAEPNDSLVESSELAVVFRDGVSSIHGATGSVCCSDHDFWRIAPSEWDASLELQTDSEIRYRVVGGVGPQADWQQFEGVHVVDLPHPVEADFAVEVAAVGGRQANYDLTLKRSRSGCGDARVEGDGSIATAAILRRDPIATCVCEGDQDWICIPIGPPIWLDVVGRYQSDLGDVAIEVALGSGLAVSDDVLVEVLGGEIRVSGELANGMADCPFDTLCLGISHPGGPDPICYELQPSRSEPSGGNDACTEPNDSPAQAGDLTEVIERAERIRNEVQVPGGLSLERDDEDWFCGAVEVPSTIAARAINRGFVGDAEVAIVTPDGVVAVGRIGGQNPPPRAVVDAEFCIRVYPAPFAFGVYQLWLQVLDL